MQLCQHVTRKGQLLQPTSRTTMLSSINRFLKAYNFTLQRLEYTARVCNDVCAYVTQCITTIKPAVKRSRGAKNTIGNFI